MNPTNILKYLGAGCLFLLMVFLYRSTLSNRKQNEQLMQEIANLKNAPKLSHNNYMFNSPNIMSGENETLTGNYSVYIRSSAGDWGFEKPVFNATKYTIAGSGILVWTKRWGNGEIPVFLSSAVSVQIYPQEK